MKNQKIMELSSNDNVAHRMIFLVVWRCVEKFNLFTQQHFYQYPLSVKAKRKIYILCLKSSYDTHAPVLKSKTCHVFLSSVSGLLIVSRIKLSTHNNKRLFKGTHCQDDLHVIVRILRTEENQVRLFFFRFFHDLYCVLQYRKIVRTRLRRHDPQVQCAYRLSPPCCYSHRRTFVSRVRNILSTLSHHSEYQNLHP